MAECKVIGRLIAVSKEQTVASADASKQPLKKREVYIDCTKYDPYTGERSEYENMPLLEFTGEKLLAKVNPVLDSLQANDIVAISFELHGRKYKNQQGQTKVMTGIRCYNIEVVRKAGQQVQQTVQQPVQQAAPAPAQQVANPNPNPFPPMPQEPPQGAAGGVDANGQPLPF